MAKLKAEMLKRGFTGSLKRGTGPGGQRKQFEAWSAGAQIMEELAVNQQDLTAERILEVFALVMPKEAIMPVVIHGGTIRENRKTVVKKGGGVVSKRGAAMTLSLSKAFPLILKGMLDVADVAADAQTEFLCIRPFVR